MICSLGDLLVIYSLLPIGFIVSTYQYARYRYLMRKELNSDDTPPFLSTVMFMSLSFAAYPVLKFRIDKFIVDFFTSIDNQIADNKKAVEK